MDSIHRQKKRILMTILILADIHDIFTLVDPPYIPGHSGPCREVERVKRA